MGINVSPPLQLSGCSVLVRTEALARDQSASLEYWQKLAGTGEIVWFYNGRDTVGRRLATF